MNWIRVHLLLVLLLSVSCRKPQIASQTKRSETFVTTPAPVAKREWGNARFDVCALLTKQEVGEVQGGSIADAKSAGGPDDGLFISQCFYMTAEMQLSVAVSLIEKDSSTSQRTPNDLWREMFHGANKPEADKSREESEESQRRERFPPQKIGGLGQEAYWKAGALYVSTGAKILRIAVSGSDTPENKLRKAKTLAGKAVEHL